AVFDTVPEPLILLDTRARVQAANRAAATRFGAGLIGVEIHQLLRQPAASDAIRRVLEHGGAEIVEIQMSGASGNVFALHVDSFRIDADSPPAALLLFTDLTDVKRAEQMRVDFIANASHELRTPLASLVGFVETLQGPARADDRARDQFMGIMQAQAARMSRLVEDLLSLSRIESSEHARPTDAVSLPAMLEAVRAGLAIEAQRLNIGLELAPVDQALPPALGDADQLAQVAQNLIENAIKYGRPDSLVTIRAFVPDQAPLAFPDPDRPMVAFAVTDQGQGIPKDVIPRLTERFYRVDAARSREMGGTGLGLAIVKHIVTRHRGALRIDSVAGAGSTFTVVLPAFEERVGGESAINFS
ncbi:MAG: ATP-binding protein, partial [Pseudomonadota bacterium]|nr:ATP-binding protein [Pseudomonadota bacterium]